MFFNPGNSNRTTQPLKSMLYSAYPNFANTTQQWLTSDTEKLYNKNKNDSDKRKLLDRLGWKHDNVEYKFNSAGFRSDEFSYTLAKSIVFLGCSHVIGIGINYQDTMAYHVCKSLSSKCYNLGLGGGTIDSCFRFAYHWIPKLKPDIVVLIQPDSARIEWYHKTKHFNHWVSLLPGVVKKWPNYLNFYESWTSAEINMKLHTESNTLAIKQICNNNNAKFLSFFNGDILHQAKLGHEKTDWARDLAHPGVKTNKKAARIILDAIDSYKD